MVGAPKLRISSRKLVHRLYMIQDMKDGVAAYKNWEVEPPEVHRSGTSIYRKKIDTQKV